MWTTYIYEVHKLYIQMKGDGNILQLEISKHTKKKIRWGERVIIIVIDTNQFDYLEERQYKAKWYSNSCKYSTPS